MYVQQHPRAILHGQRRQKKRAPGAWWGPFGRMSSNPKAPQDYQTRTGNWLQTGHSKANSAWPAEARRKRKRPHPVSNRWGQGRMSDKQNASGIRRGIGCPNDTCANEIADYGRFVRNLKVMRTAPVASIRRKPSGSSSGWRAATRSALALVVRTASARLPKADVSFSTVTPCLSHSTANISHPCAEGALLSACLNLSRACLVPPSDRVA
jgi:hypothetical protein